MDGTSPNLALMKNDILYIPSIHDLEDRGNVTVHGEVAHPDSYPYADNMTLEDLISPGRWLKEAASTVRIDVSRRIKNPRSTADNDTIGQMYTFSLRMVCNRWSARFYLELMIRFMSVAVRAIRHNRM